MRHYAFIHVLSLTILVSNTPQVVAQSRRSMGAGRPKAAKPDKPEKPAKDSSNPEPAALQQFQKMTPQERKQALAKLPADRRAKLQKQLEYYDKLTPVQRERLDWFNHLPPERQNSLRKAFQKFQNQPPARQQLMREELNNLRALPEADRAARIASPEFKSRYNKREQEILSDMATVLPTT